MIAHAYSMTTCSRKFELNRFRANRVFRRFVWALAFTGLLTVPGTARIRGEMIECTTFGSPSGVVTGNGNILIAGEPAVGTASIASRTATVGFAACLRGPSLNSELGNCDGNPGVDLADYACFLPCVTGPNQPIPSEDHCVLMDLNVDARIDLRDVCKLFRRLDGN